MDKKKNSRAYSFKEEVFNSLSHGLGVVFGIVVLSLLLYISIRKKDVKSIVGFSIYGVSLTLMYLFSTLYHSIPIKKIKKILRVFDHSGIFLFIAGTFTPIALISLGGRTRAISLIVMWLIALLGIGFKILSYRNLDRHKVLSLVLYIGMGWITVFTLKSIIRVIGIKFVIYLALGGIVYTVGTIFYANKKIPYNHAIWHLFVLAGTVIHFAGIYKYLT